MPNLEREVKETAQYLRADHKSLTEFEALSLAVKIQHNRVLEDAFLVGRSEPSALEAIAMELGAAKEGSSIKDAIFSIADALNDQSSQVM